MQAHEILARCNDWLSVINFFSAYCAVGDPHSASTEGVDEESLAWPDSQFVEVNGLRVHYQRFGEGAPAMILLHGFGASTFSWREVIKPLGAHGTAIAFDRPGFGLTERPLPQTWKGENPYTLDFQADLVIGLMDALDIPRAFLIGNSAGGTVAFILR